MVGMLDRIRRIRSFGHSFGCIISVVQVHHVLLDFGQPPTTGQTVAFAKLARIRLLRGTPNHALIMQKQGHAFGVGRKGDLWVDIGTACFGWKFVWRGTPESSSRTTIHYERHELFRQ